MKKCLVLLTTCLLLAGCLDSSAPLVPERDFVFPFRDGTQVLLFQQDGGDPTRWETDSSALYTLKRFEGKYAVFSAEQKFAEIAFADLSIEKGLLLVQFKVIGNDSQRTREERYSYGIARRIGDKLFFAFPNMKDVPGGLHEKLWVKYACKHETPPLAGDSCRDLHSNAEVREVLTAADPGYKAYLLIR